MPLFFLTIVGLLVVLGLAEVVLRQLNPHRLSCDAFDESSVTEPHIKRGWMQRKSFDFTFFHSFLKSENKVHFNNLGVHDSRDYAKEKSPGVLRIALFGDTCAAGYELPADQTIAAQLEKLLQIEPGVRQVEVINASVRNYCTSQLYQFYIDEIASYNPDVVVYLIVTNHPRRNITIHESGKPVALSQPVFGLDENDEIEALPAVKPHHPNDMIYLEADWKIKHIAGKTNKSIYRRLRDKSHVVTFLDNVYFGKYKLRQFSDRIEIKDIENCNEEKDSPSEKIETPYQWRLTAVLLEKWSAAIQENGGKFIVAPFINSYHVGPDMTFKNPPTHPLGFTFDQIPERRHLPNILGAAKAEYFDTYEYAQKLNIDLTSHYLHPRYSYPTSKGAALHAKAIADAVIKEIRPVSND